jgi:hypothetical protein
MILTLNPSKLKIICELIYHHENSDQGNELLNVNFCMGIVAMLQKKNFDLLLFLYCTPLLSVKVCIKVTARLVQNLYM